MKHLLDPRLGQRLRAALVVIAGVCTVLAQTIEDLEQVGWAAAVSGLLTFIGVFTRLGNAKPAE